MPDVACLGTVNMDIVAYVDEFPANDSEIIVNNLLYIPSGSAANVAAGIQRLGYTAAVLGAIGTDKFSEQIRNRLHEEGIDTSGLVNIDGTSGTIFIPVDKGGERRIFNSSDAPAKLSKEHINKDIIKQSKFFYMCGIASEKQLEALEEAADFAKQHGKTVIYDPTIFAYLGFEKNKKIIENTNILLVNRTEVKLLGGEEKLSGTCPVVILKLGPEGCIVITKGERTKLDGHKISAIDTTGAGDCFAAALMAKLLESKDILKAARFANKVAAISCTKHGAMATPTLEEIEEFRFS